MQDDTMNFENPIDKFTNKKKAELPYIKLMSGETVEIVSLKEVKIVPQKKYMSSDMHDVLTLVVDVKTPEGVLQKEFSNSTLKFAEQLTEKRVNIGCSFKLTREGTGQATKYLITEVKMPQKAPTQTVIGETASQPQTAPVEPKPTPTA